MMIRGLGAIAAVVAASLVVVVDGAFADPGNTSHVDKVTAVVGSEGVSVTGQASFVDMPGVAGEDPTGDAVGPEAPLGHDLTTATIARPYPFGDTPFGDTLRFTLGVANFPQFINGTPEFLVYRWEFTVTTDGQQRDFMLSAWRSNQWLNPGSAQPYFVLATCEQNSSNGVASCESLATPIGYMGVSAVTWLVPLSDIGAEPDSVISSDEGIAAVFSVSGALSGGVVYDEVTDYHPYTVPGPTVRMGIAPAGTPAEDIPLTANGTVVPAGTVDVTRAFRGILPTPATPGEYTVAVEACHGAQSCGVATTNVTV